MSEPIPIEVESNGIAWNWRLTGTRFKGTSKHLSTVRHDVKNALYYAPELYTLNVGEIVMPKHAVTPDDSKPRVIICDIDGTLAKRRDRGPYEFDRVGEDALNERVAWFLDGAFKSGGVPVVLLSGRSEECRDITVRWLNNFNVDHDHLFMRPAGDRRSDDIVKLELLQENVLPTMDPWLVLDDRNRCVMLWRRIGLECWQVDDGDF